MRHFLSRLEENIIALLLVAMTLMVFTETLLRFGFGTGLLWGQELTLHLSAWLVLFGMSYVLKQGGHIGVDYLLNQFSGTIKRYLTIISLLACLAYCILMGYGAWIYLQKMQLIGIELDDIPIPKWKAHSILVVGFILLGFRFVEMLIRVIKGQQISLNAQDESKVVIEDHVK